MIDYANEYDPEGNDTGLEKEDRESDIDVPFDPSKIDIVVDRIPISSLDRRLINSELDLTPEFQRAANIWDNKRKSRLIESILLKIPLPSFISQRIKQATTLLLMGYSDYVQFFIS